MKEDLKQIAADAYGDQSDRWMAYCIVRALVAIGDRLDEVVERLDRLANTTEERNA